MRGQCLVDAAEVNRRWDDDGREKGRREEDYC